MALLSKTKAFFFDFQKSKVEASPLVVRLTLHSSKQQGEDVTIMKIEDKLIFLYKTGYVFDQTTCLSTLIFSAVVNAPIPVTANINT